MWTRFLQQVKRGQDENQAPYPGPPIFENCAGILWGWGERAGEDGEAQRSRMHGQELASASVYSPHRIDLDTKIKAI